MERHDFARKVWRNTGRCFDDALDTLGDLLIECGVDDPRKLEHGWDHVLMVHGICIDPDGEPYAHAWLEIKDADGIWQVIQSKLMPDSDGGKATFIYPRHVAYCIQRVSEATYYSPIAAIVENNRTGHYGPWLPRYMELCADELRAKHGKRRTKNAPIR